MDETKPAILTVFGATGDLMIKKIIPSIYFLYQENRLPSKFKVLGFARRDFNGDKFCKEIVIPSIKKALGVEIPNEQCFTLFEYVQGDLNNPEDYQKLADRFEELDSQFGEESNKLFYYSISPEFYDVVTHNVDNICVNNEKVRVMVEKPYGHNLKSAIQLDQTIKKYFKEENIFRIDHYLEKEAVKQITDFKFENREFKDKFTPEHIKKIEIIAHEDFGVEDRGAFYESVGAFIDVGQNHLLSILSLVLMDTPVDDSSESLRISRSNALSNLKIMSEAEIKANTYRAQHEGYREIEEVDPDSNIETYFKIKLESQDKWAGIPLYIESGKRMAKQLKRVNIYFEEEILTFELYPTACVYKSDHKGNAEVQIQCANVEHQYVAEYGQLILDAIKMDNRYFLSLDEVLAQWKFADPIRETWDKGVPELNYYKKGETPNIDL